MSRYVYYLGTNLKVKQPVSSGHFPHAFEKLIPIAGIMLFLIKVHPKYCLWGTS
jgi:hypothetical protein